MSAHADLRVIYEHPEWQKPLFAALDKAKVRYETFDLKHNAVAPDALPRARVAFNQASPSAYVRGNVRAVPLALSVIRSFEIAGTRVLNGSRVFTLELSKSAQISLLRGLGVGYPKSVVFNDVDVLAGALARGEHRIGWPALLKPEQGGSGARMFKLGSLDELRTTLTLRPEVWLPDNLLLLQELVDHDPSRGIVRLEYVGGELLYAMRVVSHGGFNLCPSEVCHPASGAPGVCEVPAAPPVEFHPCFDLPAATLELAARVARGAELDVGGIELIETERGPIFYDINANSNLRPSVAAAFGFDPFDRVVAFLQKSIAAQPSAS